MTSRSHFLQLARLISVTDICSPFLASFESNRSVSDVYQEWSIDLCGNRNLDPMDQLALVTRDNKVVGWIGFDMLEAGKSVNDCMESITPDSLLSSDTSLFDAVAAFATSSDHFFLVLQGNQFIGWLSYQDLHKPPLRLCLFAMLINLERMLLEVALQHPRESIQFLPDARKEKAQTVYSVRKYNYTDGGEPYDSKLLECTTMIDKFTIARRTTSVLQQVTSLENVNLCNKAERLRNEIAHPGMEEQSSDLLSRDNLWKFVQWAETLEGQLKNYLESARGY